MLKGVGFAQFILVYDQFGVCNGRTVRRARRRLQGQLPPNPTSMDSFDAIPNAMSTLYWSADEGENTVKYDSGRAAGKNRIIILSTERHLQLLCTVKI